MHDHAQQRISLLQALLFPMEAIARNWKKSKVSSHVFNGKCPFVCCAINTVLLMYQPRSYCAYTHTRTPLRARTHDTYTHTHTQARARARTHARTHAHVYLHTHTHACTHTCARKQCMKLPWRGIVCLTVNVPKADSTGPDLFRDYNADRV